MLTMTNALMIEGYTVYRDDLDEEAQKIQRIDVTRTTPDDGSAPTLTATPRTETVGAPRSFKSFYVLPDKPEIARDADGKPIFSLIVYRQDETRIDPAKSKEDVGGGILTFTVELTVPQDKMDKIRRKLAAEVFADGADDHIKDVQVQQVPFLEGKVSLAVAGEATGEPGEFIKSAVGTGKVSGIGGNRKAVMIKLTQEGAALMSQIERLRTLPINVQYDLSFEHRLLGVTMRVWCDMYSSYQLFQEVGLKQISEDSHNATYGSDDKQSRWVVSKATETMIQSKTMGVQVIPNSSAVDEETLKSLEKYGFDLLHQEMDKAFQAVKAADSKLDRQYLEKYVSESGSSFNFTLDRKMVLVRNYYPSANIANVFQGQDIKDLVTLVDLRISFFAFLKIPVRVNADFSKLPLDSVVVTVIYNRDRIDGGGREQRRDSFSFTDGSTIQTFLAFANTLAEVTYDWSAIVHYKGSQENYTLEQSGVRDNFLVVDVGMLGMLQVDVGLGLVDLDKFPAANISLRYRSRALGRVLEQEFQLAKDKQTAVWTEIIHEAPQGGYEYKVDWLRKGGDILPGAWTRSSASRLRVDAPVGAQLAVSVVATGNFKEEISQVVVSLQYRDADNNYVQDGALTFTDDKQMQSWIIDLRNPERRDYRYHYSIVYKDGMVKNVPPEEGAWTPGEPGFIVVGEKYGLEVEIVPLLLTYPDHAKVVQIDLVYDDPDHGIHADKSYVFSKDNNKNVTWRVRTAPQGPKTYTVEVSYYSASGTVSKLPKRVSETEAIVLEPIPAPAAPAPAPATPTTTPGVSTLPH